MRKTTESRAFARYTGQILRTLRQRKKRTLQQVARRAKTHHPTIQRIEQGKVNVSLYVFCRILRAMGSSPLEFFRMRTGRGQKGRSVFSSKSPPLGE